MKTSVLGKSSKRIIKSGINLLDNISRIKEDINHGLDIWNVYDFMYLDKNKIPALRVLEISIPSKSDFIIESKSMKLYLNSFYNKSFKSKTEIINKIKKDLESKLKIKITIKFINSFHKEPKYIDLNTLILKKTPIKKIIKFNGFRSICPVTSQPDFANIYIYSDKSINTSWLKKYLMSFANHGGFHEQCIELIFETLKDDFSINYLEVCGAFKEGEA